jgi:hypothetical protein
MTIRDYTPNDFPQVEKLWKETGIYTAERGDTSEIILHCNLAGGKFLVMEDPVTGKIEGTSCTILPSAPHFKARDMAVHSPIVPLILPGRRISS